METVPLHIDSRSLPKEWVTALRCGWKVIGGLCDCGGNYLWMKPRSSGAMEVFGCVCHKVPVVDTLPPPVLIPTLTAVASG